MHITSAAVVNLTTLELNGSFDSDCMEISAYRSYYPILDKNRLLDMARSVKGLCTTRRSHLATNRSFVACSFGPPSTMRKYTLARAASTFEPEAGTLPTGCRIASFVRLSKNNDNFRWLSTQSVQGLDIRGRQSPHQAQLSCFSMAAEPNSAEHFSEKELPVWKNRLSASVSEANRGVQAIRWGPDGST